ncbi:nuclear transport factor 2 family protein [Aerococcaceae bacterium NML210727]|nr:nuclear transport factor 2 family protein [Aerococcaceae bacterium NML210727]MCW6654326.1 nuclear transport factor 2 family protein [Aerococcaceae bacterium NML201296]MCW6661100.1 nuclear transport factor 2 family protein [Aerococcaceae bacterium NML201209]MCW6662898.1 nuclear transport factor 2 family protein [Aerococcaceae bacterium NML190073]MCW6664159.1 nuclear transport factor 2 family protein [Aerococcaceae bacterium NML191219]MCW6666332.1 nuclear transport factor 2 family protein [Ae
MNSAELLHKFFEAENKRDWETYKQLLHPQVEWYLYGETHRQFTGIEQYTDTIAKFYEQTDIRFSCKKMIVSHDGSRIVTHLINDAGESSIDIFDFKDSLIYREYEFIMGKIQDSEHMAVMRSVCKG